MEHITVNVKTLDKIYKIIKEKNITEVPFEFLIGSCFPNIMDNIKTEMKRQHAMGYAEGLKESDSK